jgi:uncharacterized membrane protein
VVATHWRYFTIIAFGYIASTVAYSRLPGPYLMGDRGVRFFTEMIAVLLPTTAAVTYLLLRRLWVRDSIRERGPTFEATYDAILFRIILFVIVLHVAVMAGMVGLLHGQLFAPRLVVILAGLVFVGVGNLLPRTRPNLVIGIRTSRTLADRGLWIRTHRVGGYVTVGLGVVIVLAGVFLSKSTIPDVIGTAGLVGSAFILVSYRRYSRV